MALPEPVAALLGVVVDVGTSAQAFPFLTVDAEGLPHVALLSARELAAGRDGSLLVALGAPTTAGNLRRTGAATLLAVEGRTAHSVKLRVRRLLDDGDLVGAQLDPLSHKADSLGIPLAPITFVATDEVRRLDRWERTAALLARLDVTDSA